MEFALVCIGMLVVLAIVAAIASHFDKGSDEIVQAEGNDCASCTADCKLKEIGIRRKETPCHDA